MQQEKLETMTTTSYQSQRFLVVHKLERTHNLNKKKMAQETKIKY